jgi:hypothetical protein
MRSYRSIAEWLGRCDDRSRRTTIPEPAISETTGDTAAADRGSERQRLPEGGTIRALDHVYMNTAAITTLLIEPVLDSAGTKLSHH